VSNAEKQLTGHGPEGCDENGPAAALLVGYVSDSDMRPPRALPTAHFDRNESHVIYGTGHSNRIGAYAQPKFWAPVPGLPVQLRSVSFVPFQEGKVAALVSLGNKGVV